MKITKLPNKIDPNKMIEEEIDKNNSICPMCGEHAEYQFDRLYGGGSGIEKVPIINVDYFNRTEFDRWFVAYKCAGKEITNIIDLRNKFEKYRKDVLVYDAISMYLKYRTLDLAVNSSYGAKGYIPNEMVGMFVSEYNRVRGICMRQVQAVKEKYGYFSLL